MQIKCKSLRDLCINIRLKFINLVCIIIVLIIMCKMWFIICLFELIAIILKPICAHTLTLDCTLFSIISFNSYVPNIFDNY